MGGRGGGLLARGVAVVTFRRWVAGPIKNCLRLRKIRGAKKHCSGSLRTTRGANVMVFGRVRICFMMSHLEQSFYIRFQHRMVRFLHACSSRFPPLGDFLATWNHDSHHSLAPPIPHLPLNDNSSGTSLSPQDPQTSSAHTAYYPPPAASGHTARAPASTGSSHVRPRISGSRRRLTSRSLGGWRRSGRCDRRRRRALGCRRLRTYRRR